MTKTCIHNQFWMCVHGSSLTHPQKKAKTMKITMKFEMQEISSKLSSGSMTIYCKSGSIEFIPVLVPRCAQRVPKPTFYVLPHLHKKNDFHFQYFHGVRVIIART